MDQAALLTIVRADPPVTGYVGVEFPPSYVSPLKHSLEAVREGSSTGKSRGRNSCYPYPRISILRGCRTLARAHLYMDAQDVVVRVLSPECSMRAHPSEYRGSMHGSAYGLL